MQVHCWINTEWLEDLRSTDTNKLFLSSLISLPEEDSASSPARLNVDISVKITRSVTEILRD